MEAEMNFHTRKWVKPEDLNPNQTLFGGKLLQWIDEEAVIYAIVQLENPRVVTKFISEINFIAVCKYFDSDSSIRENTYNHAHQNLLLKQVNLAIKLN